MKFADDLGTVNIQKSGTDNDTWATWVKNLMHPDDQVTAARRSGFDKSTMTRWLKGSAPDAERAVAFARAYGAAPVEALVVMGLIRPDEADLVPADTRTALRTAPDEALLSEVRARMAGPRERLPIRAE